MVVQFRLKDHAGTMLTYMAKSCFPPYRRMAAQVLLETMENAFAMDVITAEDLRNSSVTSLIS